MTTINDAFGLPSGSNGHYPTQLPADVYAAGTGVTEAIDVTLFHQIGVIASADAVNVLVDIDIEVECNDTYLTADPGWTAVGVTFLSGNLNGRLLKNLAVHTWGAASTAEDNYIVDGIRTENLPAGTRYVRLRWTVAGAATEVLQAALLVGEPNYSESLPEGANVPSEQV